MTKRRASGERRSKARIILLLCCIAVAGLLGVQGTISWLTTKTESVQNTFTPAAVSCEVTESFNGTTKTNVNVFNTGDTDAYIRVKLVSYRVNAQNQRIGGQATIPSFTPGEGWVRGEDGFYYYMNPVAPEHSPTAPLIPSVTLTGSYSDADAGKQVIEVLAEAIQSEPAQAVKDAWPKMPSSN